MRYPGMNAPSQPTENRFAGGFRVFSELAAGVALIVGSAALMAWLAPLPELWQGARLSMADDPNLAFAFILAALAALLNRRNPRFSQMLGFALGTLAAVTFLHCLDRSTFVLDLRWLQNPRSGDGSECPAGALAFTLLGTALLLAPWRKAAALSQFLGLIVAAIGLLAVFANWFDVAILAKLPAAANLAPSTAFLLALLGLAVALLSTRNGLLKILCSDTDGGMLARWMLPGSVLIPLLTGSAVVEGNARGFYDAASAMALFAVATAAVFLTVIWSSAHWLMRMEARRREAERAARLSDARFRRLVDSNIIGVITADLAGHVSEANDAFLQMMDYTREDLLAGKIRGEEMTPPEMRLRTEQAVGEILATGVAAPFEHETLRKDGSRLKVVVGAARLEETSDFCVAFILDVSARKRAEEERDRFFTVSLDLLCVAGIDGRFRRLNPAFERTLGYSEEELLQRPFVEFVHPNDRDATLAEVQKLAHCEQTIGFENRYRCKDGTMRWMLWSAAATPDGTIYAAARDITERKRDEEELRHTAVQLQRSNSELAQFAYIASHDLQEPLRAVSGCVQLLQQKYQGQLDAPADELIGHVVDGAARMKSLITDLLAYSKVGRTAPEPTPVDLGEAFENALANLRTAIEESGAKITRDVLPTLTGDATLLTQLFQNLVGNALKFRREIPPEIHLAAGRRGEEWVFALSDNGIGIDPQYFQRIFGIFQRLHTRRDFPGTGIGLALCQKIVERHGGKITVQSEPGRGSTFRFTLPDHSPK